MTNSRMLIASVQHLVRRLQEVLHCRAAPALAPAAGGPDAPTALMVRQPAAPADLPPTEQAAAPESPLELLGSVEVNTLATLGGR